MSTTSLTAAQVMDRVAVLLNDPTKTDYTYTVQVPYLNMALDEMMEALQESNASPSSLMSDPITVPIGMDRITFVDFSTGPNYPRYPDDVAEIQEVSERLAGSNDSFIPLTRREFINAFPASNAFLFWTWQDQAVKFNSNGATTIREIQLKYIRGYKNLGTGGGAITEGSYISIINSGSFLVYKTASLCAQFIGENESRATLLESKAERALERMIGISNKGKQQIMTRHRPFRAAYKARGGY